MQGFIRGKGLHARRFYGSGVFVRLLIGIGTGFDVGGPVGFLLLLLLLVGGDLLLKSG